MKKMGYAIYACTLKKLADKAVDLQIIALYAVDFVKSLASGVASLAASTAAGLG